MRNGRHLLMGCGFASAVILVVFAVGCMVIFRSFVGNLPFLQTEADRAQQHVQAEQIIRDAKAQEPWTGFNTAMRELGIAAIWSLPVVLVVGLAGRGYRQARWIWPRDGMWPMQPREIKEKTDIAIEAVRTRNLAEVRHAEKPNAPVHMHVTGKATKETDPDLPAEQPTAQAPSFSDLGERGLFDGDD
jgi:hypothetical protein